MTRSRAVPRDDAALALRSHTKSQNALGTTIENEISRQESENPSETLTESNVSQLKDCRSPSLQAAVALPQLGLTNPEPQTEPAEESIENTELELEYRVQACKDSFQDQNFVITTFSHSETVFPVEIDDFFSKFQKGHWLSASNLMPLIFSFTWPSTTLLLHSSFTPSAECNKDRSKSVQKSRWPLADSHDRLILPCCSHNHWTLIEVDLQLRTIRQYNSLAKDISESAQLISVVEERIVNATNGRNKVDFTMENGVCSSTYWFFLYG